jgi:hypothetical protein
MKYQATRNGQFIGEPKNTKSEAQQVIDEDKAHSKACLEQGWITKRGFDTTRWYIRKVRW